MKQHLILVLQDDVRYVYSFKKKVHQAVHYLAVRGELSYLD